MKQNKPQVIVGTSGWQYGHWNGKFYPDKMKAKDKLAYFAEHFHSVEINSTFYHVPLESSVQNWYDGVPADFKYVIKLNRFLTHTKRLTSDEQFSESLHDFFRRISLLKEKLAAVLVQLPPSMKADNNRLEFVAVEVEKYEKEFGVRFPLAFECRNISWFNQGTFDLMKRYNIANVINDSPNRWPASTQVTADFAYIRFHGNKQLYRSSYSDEELKDWAGFIKTECKNCKTVYCYFNNDFGGAAIDNAQTLAHLV
ncbi:MAG: hypothetical protein JWO47_923 [Candidatus Saccharibacteria bacterium]|nr:hypothetical protein [Candidatus Saccharibacteria bacterium]